MRTVHRATVSRCASLLLHCRHQSEHGAGVSSHEPKDEVQTQFATEKVQDAGPSRPLTEEDRLARDIALLGKQQRENKERVRVRVAASDMPKSTLTRSDRSAEDQKEEVPSSSEAASFISPLPSTNVGQQGGPTAATPSTKMETLVAPSWTPSFNAAPYAAKSTPLTDVAYTLEEIEQTLFGANVAAQEEVPTEGANIHDATQKKERKKEKDPFVEGIPPKAEQVVADEKPEQPTAHQRGLAASPKTPPSPPPAKTVEKIQKAPPITPKSRTETPVAPAAAAPDVEAALTSFGNSRIPCVYNQDGMDTAASSPGRPVQRRATSAVRFAHRVSENLFAIYLDCQQGSTLTQVEELHRALTQVEERCAAHRKPHELVEVHMMLLPDGRAVQSRQEKMGELMEQEEAMMPAMERVNALKRRHHFLERIATAPRRGLKMVCHIDSQRLELSGLAVEIILCCQKCVVAGPGDNHPNKLLATLNFPFLFGLFPSPCTVRSFAARWEGLSRGEQDRLWTEMQPQDPLCPTSGSAAAGLLLPQLNTPLFVSLLSSPFFAEGSLERQASLVDTLWETLRSCVPFLKEQKGKKYLTRTVSTVPQHSALSSFVRAFCDYCDACVSAKSTLSALECFERFCHAKESYFCRRILLAATPRYQWQAARPYVKTVKTSLLLLSPELLKNFPEFEEMISTIDTSGGKKYTIVVPADLSESLKAQVVATVQTSMNEKDYTLLFLGRPSAFVECASTTSLAAVASPVAAVPSGGPNLPQPLKVVELSFTGVSAPTAVGGAAPAQRVLLSQAASLQWLNRLGNAVVPTATGTVSVGLVATLAAALSVAAQGEDAFANTAVQFSMMERLGVLGTLQEVLAASGMDAILDYYYHQQHHAGYLKRLLPPGVVLGKEQVQQLCRAEPTTPLFVKDDAAVLPMTRKVFLALVDYCCVVLLNEEVLCVNDLNVLSVAALRLHPMTGGILNIADSYPGGLEAIAYDMSQHGKDDKGAPVFTYASLPVINWLAERGLSFATVRPKELRPLRTLIK